MSSRRDANGNPSGAPKESAATAMLRIATSDYGLVVDTGTGKLYARKLNEPDAAPISMDALGNELARRAFDERNALPGRDAIAQVVGVIESTFVKVNEYLTLPGGEEIPEDLDPQADTLVDDLKVFVRRFVKMSDEELLVFVLWLIHTHVMDAADFTPYMVITSPTKGCGKTTLAVKIPRLLASSPKASANISGAALFRSLALGCTFLLDETDGVWKGNQERAEDLRGILNAGFSRGEGVVTRMVGQGADMDIQDFYVFGPKTVAGIGRLIPETVMDRGLGIRLQKAPRKAVEKLRERRPPEEAGPLRMRIMAWAEQNLEALRNHFPPLPETLDARGEDIAEPLVAIADALGCGEAARDAIVLLRTGESSNTEDSMLLLADIREVWAGRPNDSKGISSQDLLDELCGIEASRWAAWWGDERDRRKGAMKLSEMLSEFDIEKAKQRWEPADTRRWGYEWSQFDAAWERYLPLRAPLEGERLDRLGIADEHRDSADLEVGTNPEPVQPEKSRKPASAKGIPTSPTSYAPEGGEGGMDDEETPEERAAR